MVNHSHQGHNTFLIEVKLGAKEEKIAKAANLEGHNTFLIEVKLAIFDAMCKEPDESQHLFLLIEVKRWSIGRSSFHAGMRLTRSQHLLNRGKTG